MGELRKCVLILYDNVFNCSWWHVYTRWDSDDKWEIRWKNDNINCCCHKRTSGIARSVNTVNVCAEIGKPSARFNAYDMIPFNLLYCISVGVQNGNAYAIIGRIV